jgi:hypothetical protein
VFKKYMDSHEVKAKWLIRSTREDIHVKAFVSTTGMPSGDVF